MHCNLQLAGMWEFCRGPAGTFGAVAFTSYGGFWMSFAYLFSFVRECSCSTQQLCANRHHM